MTYFKLFRDLHGPWSGPCAHSGGCHVGRVWPPLARPSSQWMIGIYWNIIHDEYIPVYFGHIHCGLNMDDIPVYFMMFIYIYIVYDVYHVTSHITSTYYCNTLHLQRIHQRCQYWCTDPNMSKRGKDSWPLAPIPCWSWHWLIQALIKKTWLSDLGVFSCS